MLHVKHSSLRTSFDVIRQNNNVKFANVGFWWQRKPFSNMSKSWASAVHHGFPKTEKQMKTRCRRRSAFIVSTSLEPVMKYRARVFDMSYLMKQLEILQWHAFSNLTIINFAVLHVCPSRKGPLRSWRPSMSEERAWSVRFRDPKTLYEEEELEEKVIL